MINGLFAQAADNVWAVGYEGTPIAFAYDPLIEHWDGTVWTKVEGARLPSGATGGQNIMHDVWASSATDAWAVGNLALGLGHPLLEHWDGTTWTLVKEQSYGGLQSISGGSAIDIWAVGSKSTDTTYPLTEHWDGSKWSVQAAPNPTNNSSLAGIDELSASDTWAVGLDNVGTVIDHSTGPCT